MLDTLIDAVSGSLLSAESSLKVAMQLEWFESQAEYELENLYKSA
jgi:hypothetical protein